jgi:hypothetical protein
LEQFAMSVETWVLSFLIAVVVAVLLTYIVVFLTQVAHPQETSNQAVVKHDWRPSGRIDFAVRLDGVNVPNEDGPREFKLLVEERRIVESIAGGENLEIQWRLARLSEAKTVITQYHKYLSENSLIRSVPDLTASTSPPTVPSDPVDQSNLSIVASAERNP